MMPSKTCVFCRASSTPILPLIGFGFMMRAFIIALLPFLFPLTVCSQGTIQFRAVVTEPQPRPGQTPRSYVGNYTLEGNRFSGSIWTDPSIVIASITFINSPFDGSATYAIGQDPTGAWLFDRQLDNLDLQRLMRGTSYVRLLPDLSPAFTGFILPIPEPPATLLSLSALLLLALKPGAAQCKPLIIRPCQRQRENLIT